MGSQSGGAAERGRPGGRGSGRAWGYGWTMPTCRPPDARTGLPPQIALHDGSSPQRRRALAPRSPIAAASARREPSLGLREPGSARLGGHARELDGGRGDTAVSYANRRGDATVSTLQNASNTSEVTTNLCRA